MLQKKELVNDTWMNEERGKMKCACGCKSFNFDKDLYIVCVECGRQYDLFTDSGFICIK